MEYKKVEQDIFDSKNDSLEKLAQLFPSAVKDGELDIEALKEELGDFQEVEKEKFELTWAGKQNAKKVAQQDIVGKTLKFVPEDSKNHETTENLYIEGDNLEVLKLLRANYYGKIKMIYIDPPYNTGNDFVYNDKFSMDVAESDIAEGDVSELGERYKVNQKSTNRYHANWLNMMYPRLRVAKDLLTDDGVIFISIDDNELYNLKKICDEIFTEHNLICEFPRLTKKAGKSSEDLAKNNDFILCYQKSPKNKLNAYEHTDDGFKHEDEYLKERGKYKLNQTLDYGSIQYSPSLDYEINIEGINLRPGNATKEEMEERKKRNPKTDFCWRWSKELYSFGLKNGFIVLKQTSNGHRIYTKTYEKASISKIDDRYIIEEKNRTKSVTTLDFVENLFSNDNSKKDLNRIFAKNIFDYSKPLKLLRELIFLGTNEKDIILDFFSGSSTTAHAVMQLNAEDGGHRKFIMVQLAEETDEKSEAYKNNFKNICEIGRKRIDIAGEKIKEDFKGKEGIEDLNIGFKVFRVGDTNIKWINKAVKGKNVIDAQYDFDKKDELDFMENFTDIDVVYEIMLRQRDIPLSSSVEKLDSIGERTYIFANAYVVSLEEKITEEMISKFASIEPLPMKFVFRDSAFEDDIELKDTTFRRLQALIEKNTGEKKKAYTVEFI